MRPIFLSPLLRLLRNGQLTALRGVGAELKPFYNLTYLAAAGEAGLLTQLASGPVNFSALAEFFAAEDQGKEALEAWLQMGVRLRFLTFGPRGYELRGLAELLSRPENDSVLALVEEVAARLATAR